MLWRLNIATVILAISFALASTTTRMTITARHDIWSLTAMAITFVITVFDVWRGSAQNEALGW